MTEPVLVSQASRSDNSRVKKMGIAGGVLVLALFVGPKVLGGGGGGDDAALFPPTNQPSPAAPAAPKPNGDPSITLASGRNPFTPLVDVQSSGDDGGAPAASVAATPGPDPLASGPVPVDLPVAADAGAPATNQTTPTTAPPPPPVHRLSLLEVYTDQSGRSAARVRVDDDVMETLVGQDFGGNYRTISLDRASGCGVFLYGDQRITLCEGHEAVG